MRRILEVSDYTVHCAASLEQLPYICCGKVCAVIDIAGAGFAHWASHLQQRGMDIPVIAISAEADIPLAVDTIRRGAVDFLAKPFSDAQLLAAVALALHHGPSKPHVSDDQAVEIAKRMETLSGREKDVLRGLLAGNSNKVIAHRLGISPRTVEIHRANLMMKMQAETLSALVTMALVNTRYTSAAY